MSIEGIISKVGNVQGSVGGLKTINGYSAYEIALINGFKGTEEEWLESLVGPEGPEGPAGAEGQPGKDGTPGKDGEPGKDGRPGKDGAPGEDGFSPSITVTTIANGHRVTITDANGTQSFDVMNGSGGGGGSGENGVTFYPTVDAEGNISWTNDGGLTNPDTVNIKGPAGENGQPGEKGEKGDKGDTGETGPKGDQGEQGPKGETGPEGPQGPKGDTGEKGADGAPGEKGDKGDKGDDGAPGATGPVGPAGSWTQYTGTLPSSGWATDSNGYMAQTITIQGLAASYDVSPDIDVVLSGSDLNSDSELIAAFGLISVAGTVENGLVAKCVGDAPSINIPIIVRVQE